VKIPIIQFPIPDAVGHVKFVSVFLLQKYISTCSSVRYGKIHVSLLGIVNDSFIIEWFVQSYIFIFKSNITYELK